MLHKEGQRDEVLRFVLGNWALENPVAYPRSHHIGTDAGISSSVLFRLKGSGRVGNVPEKPLPTIVPLSTQIDGR